MAATPASSNVMFQNHKPKSATKRTNQHGMERAKGQGLRGKSGRANHDALALHVKRTQHTVCLALSIFGLVFSVPRSFLFLISLPSSASDHLRHGRISLARAKDTNRKSRPVPVRKQPWPFILRSNHWLTQHKQAPPWSMSMGVSRTWGSNQLTHAQICPSLLLILTLLDGTLNILYC